MIGCVKCFKSSNNNDNDNDNNNNSNNNNNNNNNIKKTISFKVIDNKLLKTCIIIWKVSNLMDIKSDSEPVYGDNDKYVGTKTKICGDKVHANFQGKEIPKLNTPCNCLSLIMLDSVIKVNKEYYSQTLLEECKYERKKTKMENLINEDLESCSADMKLKVTLIMRPMIILKSLIINLTMNNFLKVKVLF